MARKVGIHLMTHRPELMENWFMATVHNMKEIAEISKFGISFNGENYTEDHIKSIVERLEGMGFEVEYNRVVDQSIYMDRMQVLKYRSNSIGLLAGCRYFLILDDDMKFGHSISGSKADPRSSGGQYRDIVEYLDNHPKCGCVQIGGYLGTQRNPGGTIHGLELSRYIISTGRGLFMRNILDDETLKDKFVPDELIEMEGAGEESAIGFVRIMRGYYAARMTCGRAQHPSKTDIGRDDNGWGSMKVLESENGIVGMFRRLYGMEVSFHKRGPVNAKIGDQWLDATCGYDPKEYVYSWRDKW